jgi:phage terminase small subunit
MTKEQWGKIIVKQMKAVGTYAPAYKQVVETLAGILEKRDAAKEDWEASGGEFVTEHISDRGACNTRKNPSLQVWQDLNTQALAYWKELGLTPAGLKKIKDMVATSKTEVSGLEKALSGLAGELGKSS